MYGTHHNKKIVGWLINRKKHFNEKERQAFFKTLNPHLNNNQPDSTYQNDEMRKVSINSARRNSGDHLKIDSHMNKSEILDESQVTDSPLNDGKYIQTILFEFPYQLKSFLRSLFQLKPILISSYSVDKFRIVIENYVQDNRYYLGGLEEVIGRFIFKFLVFL